MRVKIGEQLERRIERVYQLAGYSRKGDLIREATRQHVDELESECLAREQPVRDAFESSIDRGGVGGPEIRLAPESESPIRFEYFYAGTPPHTTILDTGITFVPEVRPTGSDLPGIKDTLEAIEGVERANVLTEGVISVKLEEDTLDPLGGEGVEEPLVDRIYDELGDLVQAANRRVHNGEETREEAKRRATKDYNTSSVA